jgi:nitroreductase
MLSAEQWADVVGQAVRAPSIHNTQPWLFVATGRQVEVHLDPTRALPAIDASRRQQVLSCGVAVHFAVVALAALGFDAQVDVLPDDADADHLATIRVIGEHRTTPEERQRAEAIARRHTDRSPFRNEPIPAALIDRLQADVGRDGVWLKPVSRAEEQTATAFLVDQAEEMELRDPAYVAELESWTRQDPGAPDGVQVSALPAGNRSQRASTWSIRDFLAGSGTSPAAPVSTDDPAPPVERPSVLLLGTMGDDRAAWVRAGSALGELLLEVTLAGLAASPLTQALDHAWARTRLSHRLDLVGHPQMLLRLGHPAGEAALSGRRPVAEVLQVR